MFIVKKFPYKENSIDGFITYFGKDDSIYTFSMIPELYTYPASNCIDRNTTTFCHTTETQNIDEHYILIHMTSLPFLLEGYSIRNREDGFHNPLAWEFQVSNDNINYFPVI